MTPSLSITYNNRNGDGLLGIGWGIGGLSAISRCNATWGQDSAAYSPQLTSSDRFCLDGNRLRTTNGSTYGASGATYQTELATFANITSNGTAGSGPASFTVQGRDGLTYQYGDTTDSAILAYGTSSVRVWALNAVLDRNGNKMTYTYTNDTTNGSYRIASIQYTYTGSSSSNNGYSIAFTYQSRPSTDQRWKYTIGGVNNQLNYLSSVTVKSGTAMVHGYTLSYLTAPTTNRMRLASVQECATNFTTDCFVATSINYQPGQAGWGAEVAQPGNATNLAFALPIDLNGDGIDDLVYADPASGDWYYELASSAGTYAGPYDTGIASTNYQSALAMDFYSNGKQDVLVPNASGYWRVMQFVSAGAAFTYVDTTTSAAGVVPGSAMVGDVDGDGRPDLIYAVSGGTGYASADYLYYRLNNGGAFSTTQGTLAAFPNGVTCQPCVKFGNSEPFGNPGYRFASQTRTLDFNGDGRADLLVYLGTCNPEGPPGQCGNSNNPILYRWTLFLSQPSGTYIQADAVTYTIGTTPNQPPLTGDFNGDGCTDIAYTVGNVWTLRYGTCGRTGTPSVLNDPVTTNANFTVGPALAVDWDGDGRTDIVQPASGASPDWMVARSTGDNLNAFIDTSVPTGGTTLAQVADVNGDGQPDLIYALSTTALKTKLHSGANSPPDLATSFVDGQGNSISPSYSSIPLYAFVWNPPTQGFPYLNYTGPTYICVNVVYSDPSGAPGSTYNVRRYYAGALTNLQRFGYVGLSAVQTYDSRSGIWETRDYSRDDFPFTGMLTVDLADQNNSSAQAIYNINYTLTSLAAATLSSTANNERYFPYATNVTRSDYEVAGIKNNDLITTTSTSYVYDSYGNATNVTTVVTDNDSSAPASPYAGKTWTTAVTNTTDISANPSADLSAWCLTMLDERQIVYSSTAGGSSSVTRTQQFTPDTPAECRTKGIITEPTANSGLYKVTEAFAFDTFGNIKTDTVTGANMPSSPASRLTTYNWGTSGQFLNSVTDPSGATTTWTYTSNQALAYGVPDTVQNANSLTTKWYYDDFGRKNKEVRADGTSTTWAWTACSAACGWSNSIYQIAQTAYQTNGTTAIRTDTTAYDPIDRPTQTAGPNVTGATATVQRLYNPMGLLKQQSMPFLSGTPYLQTYLYDMVNRPTSVTRPISSTNSNTQSTTYLYEGRTHITKDPYQHAKTTVMDVNGWLRETTDAIGYSVTRAYDAAGSLTGVTDSVGNTLLSGVTYAYGIKPFLTAATDADRGAWSYTVDSLGEVTGWKDAKLQSFSMTYDSLSRPLTRTEPDQFSQWTWGSTPANHNVGQLITECTGTGTACSTTTGYSETRTFDSYGRPFTVAVTEGGNPGNDPGGVFLFTRAYNTTTGLLNSLTYPISTGGVALNLQYGYGNGLLSSITDTTDTTATCGSTCTLWTANAMNGFGQVTQETLGNGVVTNRIYDPVTSWLSKATAGVGSSTAVLNQSYLQDENGNIAQRQDNNAGLTESFGYDADNRLTCTALSSTCTTATVAYDAGVAGPGNITSQSGVGTYTYPAAGQPRPHAVTALAGTFNGIVNPSFAYDANGNMTNRASSSPNVSWYSYNYPASISATDVTGNEEVQFNYGPDRQRWKQTYTGGPNGTEFTYYIGGLVDLVFIGGVANYRHYIYAGGEPIAVYNRTASYNTMSYMLEDHQGGVSAILSPAGTSYVDESFSAFGQRRNPSTWSGSPNSTDLNTIAALSRQGYTFQTWLGQSMGLNHMNGRVQDAILGRFLSADPNTPDPTNAQSYNRYSYVNNNPVSHADPTGFAECAINAAPNTQWACTGTNIYQFLTPSSASDSPEPVGQSPGDAEDDGDSGATDPTGGNSPDQASNSSGNPSDAASNTGSAPNNATANDPTPNGNSAQSQHAQSGQPIDMSPSSDGLDPIVVTAQSAHFYAVNVMLCDDCSVMEGFNAMRNFSAPGAPYAQDGTHRVVLPGLESPNPILQSVDPKSMTITNQTLPGHAFGGTVVISVGSSDGVVSVDIVGAGVGPRAEWNQVLGPIIFSGLAYAAYLNLHPSGINQGP
jgi:RHS repeat-associated protein